MCVIFLRHLVLHINLHILQNIKKYKHYMKIYYLINYIIFYSIFTYIFVSLGQILSCVCAETNDKSKRRRDDRRGWRRREDSLLGRSQVCSDWAADGREENNAAIIITLIKLIQIKRNANVKTHYAKQRLIHTVRVPLI